MIRYPSPFFAAKNSPMITPTRQSPIFTFILLIIAGQRAWEYNLCKRLKPAASHRIDQFDLAGVYGSKIRVKVQDTSEDRDGHTGYNDGSFIGAQPYNKKRSQCRFWQAV